MRAQAPERSGGGLKVPSNNHLKLCGFILVKDPERRRKVAELVAKGKNITNEMET
ncbi:MAG: hypothetical protein ACLFVP_01700 [Candidatus Bathyarchaeia archaeon]